MATIKKELAKKLASIGITETDEVKAREALKKMLKKEDIPVDPKDTLEDLFDMAEAFYVATDVLEVGPDVSENDDEDEEIEEPIKKVLTKKPSKAKAVVIEEDEDLEDEDDEVPVAKKADKKSTNKLTVVKGKASKEKDDKESKVRGVRFEPLTNKDHDALLNPLRKVFKDGKLFEVTALHNGVSVFYLAKNSKIIFFSLKNGTVVNGDVQGVLWNNRFKDADKFYATGVTEDYFGDEVLIGKKGSEPLVTIRRITVKQWVEILDKTNLLSANIEQITNLDIKMGKNREKLEQSLKKGTKVSGEIPAPKKSSKAPVAIYEGNDDEEEELVEETHSKKAAAKKTPTKKVAVEIPEDDDEDEEIVVVKKVAKKK